MTNRRRPVAAASRVFLDVNRRPAASKCSWFDWNPARGRSTGPRICMKGGSVGLPLLDNNHLVAPEGAPAVGDDVPSDLSPVAGFGSSQVPSIAARRRLHPYGARKLA